jgi:inhibitor of KinA
MIYRFALATNKRARNDKSAKTIFMIFHPLGDQALLTYCLDEGAAVCFARHVRGAALSWVVDVVQAYASVAVYYDLDHVDYEKATSELGRIEESPRGLKSSSRLVTIPCCYEMGLDWARLEHHLGLAREEQICLHSETVYTVYAIGFCPGFPYLGYLPERLVGVPRLPAPRIKVAAGSVGLTGRQTGIYTEERPGGWNIVGRTPFELVNVSDNYFPLETGDRVKFQRIDEREFQKLAGTRLDQDRLGSSNRS